MFKLRFSVGAFAVLLSMIGAMSPSFAAPPGSVTTLLPSQANKTPINPLVGQPATMNLCAAAWGNTINICGRNVSFSTLAEPLGASFVTEILPPPFVPSAVTISCVYDINMHPIYSVQNLAPGACELLKCPASQASFCDIQLPIPGGAVVGDTVNVPVPDSLFVDPTVQHNLTVSAQCVSQGAVAAYNVQDTFPISCNQFPCEPKAFAICGSEVDIAGGAAIGNVLQMKMPPPFVPDPFAVQCVGSNGERPAYQVTDTSAVTCHKQ